MKLDDDYNPYPMLSMKVVGVGEGSHSHYAPPVKKKKQGHITLFLVLD